jgi:hypothetical protein
MIKHNRSKYVPIVMYIRIILAFIVLFIGLKIENMSGAVLGGLTLSLGVISGMISAYILAKPALVKLPQSDVENLSLKQMINFYIPLAITSWITLGIRPLLNLGITKGTFAVESLAVWPVVLAYLFLYTSISQSVQEIVIAEYKKENLKVIKSFVNNVAISLSLLFALIYIIKPLWGLWFINVSKLPTPLLAYLPITLGVLIFLPFCSANISFYRATLVAERQTTSITIGVFINIATLVISILLLPYIFDVAGVYIAATAYSLSFLFEVIFLLSRVTYLKKVKRIL